MFSSLTGDFFRPWYIFQFCRVINGLLARGKIYFQRLKNLSPILYLAQQKIHLV